MEEYTELPTLVIDTHNFEKAKDSLKKYSDQTNTRISISRVSNKGFMNISHNVKGEELNNIISEIQTELIDINKLNTRLCIMQPKLEQNILRPISA